MNQQLSAAPQPTSSAPAATGDSPSAVLAVPPAPPAEAAALLRAALARHTDVSDVAADLATGTPGFTLVDSRSTAAWDQGHVPGAVHLPTASVPALAGRLLDPARPVVTYCWGPAATAPPAPPSPWPNRASASRRCSAASSTGSARDSPTTRPTARVPASPTR